MSHPVDKWSLFFYFDIHLLLLFFSKAVMKARSHLCSVGIPPLTQTDTHASTDTSEAGKLPLQAALSSSDTTRFIPCEEGKVREWVTAQTDAVYFGITSLQPYTSAHWVHVFVLGKSGDERPGVRHCHRPCCVPSPPPCASPLASAAQRHLHACAKLSHPPAHFPPSSVP